MAKKDKHRHLDGILRGSTGGIQVGHITLKEPDHPNLWQKFRKWWKHRGY